MKGRKHTLSGRSGKKKKFIQVALIFEEGNDVKRRRMKEEEIKRKEGRKERKRDERRGKECWGKKRKEERQKPVTKMEHSY